jgi:dinuclear metal center YbgI/SA1388 family protein
MATREEICAFLDDLLHIRGMEDSSRNGLQVQGADEVTRVGLATDAALATYRKAAEAGCQLLFVHHGLIWGGLESITGRVHDHVRFLIRNDLSLYAAHLPLDAHPQLGNNARLADVCGLGDRQPFGDYHGNALGFSGRLPVPVSLDELAARFAAEIGGEPRSLPFGPPRITTLAVVSGGGSGDLPRAIEAGLHCFVTGEGRHENHHLALEAGINVLYLGHYRSETVGVRAVGEALAREFGVETVFIDEPTAF